MNIVQISQDKLKISLSTDDLSQYGLDYLSISTESPGTRRMLKDILTQARRCSRFSTGGSRLLIEVLPGKAGGCTMFLTKLPSGAGAEQTEQKNALSPAGQKGQTGEAEETAGALSDGYILSCGSIDDAIEAINCFALYPDIPLEKSALYSYRGEYHLTFSPIFFGLDDARLVSLLADLSEYGKEDQSTPIRNAMLAEHGHAIKSNRAVESFIRYFH